MEKNKTKRGSCKTARTKKLLRRLETFTSNLPEFDLLKATQHDINPNLVCYVDDDLIIYVPQLHAYIWRLRLFKKDNPMKHQNKLFVVYDSGKKAKALDVKSSVFEYMRKLVIQNPKAFPDDSPFFVITHDRVEDMGKDFFIHENSGLHSSNFDYLIGAVFRNFDLPTYYGMNSLKTCMIR